MSTRNDLESIETLEPAPVWRLFAGLAGVPRGSKNEEAVCRHVRSLAEAKEFAVSEDPAGNMVFYFGNWGTLISRRRR